MIYLNRNILVSTFFRNKFITFELLRFFNSPPLSLYIYIYICGPSELSLVFKVIAAQALVSVSGCGYVFAQMFPCHFSCHHAIEWSASCAYD